MTTFDVEQMLSIFGGLFAAIGMLVLYIRRQDLRSTDARFAALTNELNSAKLAHVENTSQINSLRERNAATEERFKSIDNKLDLIWGFLTKEK